METNQIPAPVSAPAPTQEQMIADIYKFTKQTRNYMRWQMYITIVLVVLPILVSLFIIPFALKGLSNAYLGGGNMGGKSESFQSLIQGLQ